MSAYPTKSDSWEVSGWTQRAFIGFCPARLPLATYSWAVCLPDTSPAGGPAVVNFLSYYFDKTAQNVNWMFNTMDVTQWGIASLVMITLGFIAIKFR